MSFLKRLFHGGQDPVAGTQAPPATTAAAAPASASQQPPSLGTDAYLRREEVADKANRLCGYRITPRPTASGLAIASADYFRALADENLPRFAERRRVFLPVTMDDIVFNRHAPYLAPNIYLILPVPGGADGDDRLYGRLAAIRGAGGKTGVAGMTPELMHAEFLQQADLVVFHLARCTVPALQAAIATLRKAHPKLEIAIEGVESWPERRLCGSWNVDFCIGSFLLTPESEEPATGIDQGRLSTIQLLNLLRSDAEAAELAEVAKRDPGLTFELLKWANSPAMGAGTSITSLQQAIYLLGREQLSRWLMISMFRKGRNRARDESLLEIAMSRARFLEQVPALGLSRAQRDELFLVGLLSVFDVLLSMSMQRVLEQMQLSAPVHQVLLHSEGPYAPLLSLALLLERGTDEQVGRRLATLGLQLDDVNRVRQEAFAWTQEALSGSFAEG